MNLVVSKIFGYFKKVETYEQLIIRWADTIILNSPYTGKLDRRGFKIDWAFEKNPETQEDVNEWMNHPSRAVREQVIATMEDKDPIKISHALTPYLESVKTFLLTEGYISEIEVVKQEWILTEKGQLVKELGGHIKYKKYRRRQINILKNQAIINLCLIVATALAAIMPFVVAQFYTQKIVVNPTPVQVNHQDKPIDTVWLRQQVYDLMQKKLSNPQPEPEIKDKFPK